MKKQKNIIILSDGSITFNYNESVMLTQSQVLFFKIDCQNFVFNQKKVIKNFEFSKSSKQSKKYFS